jgi:hypothetical protein
MKLPKWKIVALLCIAAMTLSNCMKSEEKEVLTYPLDLIDVEAVQESPATMSIAANFMWTIESTAPWLNVTPNKAVGDKVLEINVSPNTSLEVRQASFFIVGEQIRQEIKVRQKGEAPMLSLKTATAQLNAMGGEVEAEITTNVELDIVSSVDWITRITTKTVSTTKYYFDVKPNTQLTARQATITFKQKGGDLEQVLTVSQHGEAEDILLSKSAVEFDAEGGANGVEVTANVPWQAVASKTWVKIIDTKLMEKASCLFQVEANPRVEPRTAVISISKEGSTSLTRTIDITQAGAAPVMTLSPTSYRELPAAASTQKYSIEVAANFTWVADFSATASWVTDITFNTSECSFKVQSNDEVVSRSTSILFRQAGGNLTREFVISQVAATQQLVVSRQEIIVPIAAKGGYSMISVTSNVEWDYTIDVPWLTVLGTKALESKILTFSAEKNESSKARVATIRFTTSTHIETRTITQEAGEAILTVSANEFQFSANKGEAKELTVSSNIEWDIVSCPNWIHLIPLRTKSIQDSVFQVTVDDNTLLQAREGKVILSDGASLRREILVKQAGIDPSFSASVSTKYVKALGGSFSIRVEKNFATKLSILDNWIKLKDSTIGAGVRTYNFTVDVSTQNALRSGSVRFTRVDGLGSFNETLSISQEAPRVAASDSVVLRSMYLLLGGMAWSDSWDLDRPVTEWKGITLSNRVYSGTLRVEGIHRASSRVFGSLDLIQIENLEYLEVLDLSNNPLLTGKLKASWNKMVYLTTLNLGGCTFEGNIPAAWGKNPSGGYYFSALSTLILRNNALNGVVPQEVQDHTNWKGWNPAENILPQRGNNELLLAPPPPPESEENDEPTP